MSLLLLTLLLLFFHYVRPPGSYSWQRANRISYLINVLLLHVVTGVNLRSCTATHVHAFFAA